MSGRPAISAARIRFSMLAASSCCIKPARMVAATARLAPRHRARPPAGWSGRGVVRSIRPCWRRLCPAPCAQDWCSLRNRTGDRSRRPRPRTTPVGGSHRGRVGRRTGGQRRCRVWSGREDSRRETTRDLSMTPRQSMASTSHLAACTLRFEARHDDRVIKPGPPALLGNADRPRLTDQNELLHAAFRRCRQAPSASAVYRSPSHRLATPTDLGCYRPKSSAGY